MHPILNIATRAARSAGNVILRGLERLDTIQAVEKKQNDFVTEIDKQSEKIIIDTIRKTYPHHAILGEESGHLEGNEEFLWIIDPLDGTRNFMHGFPHFCVSIEVVHSLQPQARDQTDLLTPGKRNNQQRPNFEVKLMLCHSCFYNS